MTVPDWVLILTIVILLVMSAYFASSETAMMKLNVYRLRALVRRRHGGAQRAHQLLEQKDRLLGVILIYNNLVNFSAAVVASVLFTRWLGTEVGGVVTTVTITMTFLIFAEVAPKTIAAVRPEAIAYPSAYILVPLLAISKYLVLFINFCGAIVVKPFVKGYEEVDDDDLSEEELRQVFEKARKLPRNRREMMSNILDLEEETVGDVMVPRESIYGIDLDDSLDDIRARINNSNHTRLPVYRGTINDLEGVLHMREANRLLQNPTITKDDIVSVLEPTYYTPSRISLSRLASNFRTNRYRFTIAVDEYGAVVGLITIDDIIEEIVGEFTGSTSSDNAFIEPIGENTYRVSGNTLLHEINHATNLTLPEDGPRTVNGWVLDYLRRVPEEKDYRQTIDNVEVNILEVVDNAITSAEIKSIPDATGFDTGEQVEPSTDTDSNEEST